MGSNIDDTFKGVAALSAELEDMDDDDPRRADIILERDRLRADAQRLAGSLRHPRSVEAEISMLEARLAEIESLFVTKGHAEKHLTKGFSDPGAYSANINRKIATHHEAEVAEIERTLAELRAIDRTGQHS